MIRATKGAGREVERLLRDGVDPPGGDGRLLRRYFEARDEAAFEAIVERHGPLVMALCRRYLREPADVDDAFQATFLVLARKGPTLRDSGSLSCWLHGVARRVALRARSDALKRRDREGVRHDIEEAAAPADAAEDAFEALEEELARLPEKYRAPLILCHLQGRTHDQAAAELGCPVGTIKSRAARAREILRGRLARRGVDAPAGLATLRADLSASLVPPSLVATTAASLPSRTAAMLAQGVISTMSPSPWKLLGLACASVGLTAGAIALAVAGPDAKHFLDEPLAPARPVDDEPAQAQAPPPDSPAPDLKKPRVDLEQLIAFYATSSTPPAETGIREIGARLRIAHQRSKQGEAALAKGSTSNLRTWGESLETALLLEARLQDMKEETDRTIEEATARRDEAVSKLAAIWRQVRMFDKSPTKKAEQPDFAPNITLPPPAFDGIPEDQFTPEMKRLRESLIAAEWPAKAADTELKRSLKRVGEIDELIDWAHAHFTIFDRPRP